jgi:hypothetical protein
MLAFLEIMRSPNKCFTVGQCVMWLKCAECQDLEENEALEPKMFLQLQIFPFLCATLYLYFISDPSPACISLCSSQEFLIHCLDFACVSV